jgi:hypothetical protein
MDCKGILAEYFKRGIMIFMAELHPLLTKRAQGRDISGLSAYEQK